MDFIRRFLILFFPLTCHVCAVVASPTSNEFLPCHKGASALLWYCLDERPGYSADNCWDRARKYNDTCYANVRKRHRPDPDRIKAEKKAREEAMEKLRQEKGSQ